TVLRNRRLAFHLVLSSTPNRSPLRSPARAASARRSVSTTPRGSKTIPFLSSLIGYLLLFSESDITGAIGADQPLLRLGSGLDATQHGGRHVAPAGDESGKPAGLATDDEQMDVVRARHDGDE